MSAAGRRPAGEGGEGGATKPEIEFHFERRIPHPPERVFATLTDLDGLSRWLPGYVGIEKLTQGAYSRGTAWWESRRVLGRVVREHVEVARFDPPYRLGLRIDGSRGAARRGVYDLTWRLRPDGAGTSLSFSGEGRGLGRMGRLMARFLVGPFRAAVEADVDALAAHLSHDTAAPPGGRV